MGCVLGVSAPDQRFPTRRGGKRECAESAKHRRYDSGTNIMSDLLIHSIEGELVDLIDEFSDGRVQFAFLKIKDPNTSLPKSVLIGWCGEGVPERTKGYFTSHLAAVAKVLHVGVQYLSLGLHPC